MPKQIKMDIILISIAVAFGISFYLMYTRMSNTAKPKLRWLVCICLCIIGILGIKFKYKPETDMPFFFFCLCVPFVYYIFDRLFRQISFKIHNRDYILWVKGSSEIDDRLFAENPQVKTSDKIFSIGLIIIVFFTIPLGGVIFQF